MVKQQSKSSQPSNRTNLVSTTVTFWTPPPSGPLHQSSPKNVPYAAQKRTTPLRQIAKDLHKHDQPTKTVHLYHRLRTPNEANKDSLGGEGLSPCASTCAAPPLTLSTHACPRSKAAA